jgi:hypothetical protein
MTLRDAIDVMDEVEHDLLVDNRVALVGLVGGDKVSEVRRRRFQLPLRLTSTENCTNR